MLVEYVQWLLLRCVVNNIKPTYALLSADIGLPTGCRRNQQIHWVTNWMQKKPTDTLGYQLDAEETNRYIGLPTGCRRNQQIHWVNNWMQKKPTDALVTNWMQKKPTDTLGYQLDAEETNRYIGLTTGCRRNQQMHWVTIWMQKKPTDTLGYQLDAEETNRCIGLPTGCRRNQQIHWVTNWI